MYFSSRLSAHLRLSFTVLPLVYPLLIVVESRVRGAEKKLASSFAGGYPEWLERVPRVASFEVERIW